MGSHIPRVSPRRPGRPFPVMTSKLFQYVMVGGGHAAAHISNCIGALVSGGELTCLSAEEHLPYHRPPLSKGFVSSDLDCPQFIRAAESYENDMVWLTGKTVTQIGRASQTVTCADGSTYEWDKLILATGAEPIRPLIKGIELDGVLVLRTFEDALAIRAAAVGAKRASVVGAGFIGLEIGRTLASMGINVTVFEMTDRLLQRTAAPELSAALELVHRESLTLQLNASVEALMGKDGCVTEILADGEAMSTDLVVLGTGAKPRYELAEAAGLVASQDGIQVDAFMRTSDPNILAIGDCAFCPDPTGPLPESSVHRGTDSGAGHVRLESIQNANDQARVACLTLAGNDQPYRSVPWFWSEQGNIRLQIAGLGRPEDEIVTRGDPRGKYAIFHFRDGLFVSLDTFNQPALHLTGRKLLDRGGVTKQQIVDADYDLSVVFAKRRNTT